MVVDHPDGRRGVRRRAVRARAAGAGGPCRDAGRGRSRGRGTKRAATSRDVVARQDGRYLGDVRAWARTRVSPRITSSSSSSARRSARDRPTVAGRARLDLSDRQQHQRRDRPGPARSQPRGLSLEAQDARGRWVSGRAGPRISGRQEQDDPDRPRRASRAPASPARAGCGCGRTSRSTGTRWRRRRRRRTPRSSTTRLAPTRRRAALPRLLARRDQRARDVPEMPVYDRIANTSPALARSRRLLHAVRRRARAARRGSTIAT